MITEDYCSYEVANLLKEKGFEGICDYAYSNKGNYFEIDRSNFDEVYCLRPTLQMAMKWLREKHGIFIGIQPYDSYYEERYEFEISTKQNNSYEWDFKDVEDSIFEGYENAVEAALKYCLENLI